jgi:hypothetical protein
VVIKTINQRWILPRDTRREARYQHLHIAKLRALAGAKVLEFDGACWAR